MNTQKNTILPTQPLAIEGQIEYNKQLVNKLQDVIRNIAVDLEALDAKITASDAAIAALTARVDGYHP